MDKAYDSKLVEGKIYRMWEKGGYFKPKIDKKKKPFTIILPPPNANADLHLGHAMYVIEDIMTRYHRMIGDPTLWLPGADHAGFETQYVFEKELAKKDKSRFDFPRDVLYKMIWDFVHENRGKMENQLRRLGFSLDWSRNVFTLDQTVVTTVYTTFKRLFDEGLVYRGLRLVNYCTKDGTGFSDLEVKHVERADPLYYMKYGPFILATVRPETKFGDTAVAVNPKDKRYKKWIGKEIEVEGLLRKFKMKVVGDDAIDPSFGTGVAKVTPSHDFTDYEIAKRHNLPMKQVIGFDGRLTDIAGPYAGLKVKTAREKVVEEMKTRGMIDHIDENYTHTVATCYKCGTVIEPLPLEQWYVKIKPLATQATKAIKEKKIAVVPRRFEKHMIQWLTNFADWNISRQLVWGMRIPAWKCQSCNEWTVTEGEEPNQCSKCHKTKLQQDTDTFDTWFSSGQWPFATLRVAQGKLSDFRSNDFNYFYPTSVMETAYDILPWWVCRMIMLGLYVTNDVPFRTVYYHGLIRDSKGQKMSKSKGNVLNPLRLIDQYGADALRFSLVFGTAAGNDQSISEDKIRGMRNFANKLWNAARFVTLLQSETKKGQQDITFKKEMDRIIHKVTSYMDKFNFNAASELLYESFWHWYCDQIIEQAKNGKISKTVLHEGLLSYLKLLHPFMPFVTEELYQKMPGWNGTPLIVSSWPV
ncbi:valine--tRNA ligase [Candidatus Gottesmanbacteria bacterium RIFCSPLOWO2_01_FULL_43_11b]|uniref:Valine--tRNA ligase n=1 Tax=Candidatus Gottesmanbacteria bacterium RIFCSPLOWO2_01_FULL_43_11b TaxID=1798392 RepID=A0A1F6AID6_9BACT|nr:MAG: valine--tRNA ligase [Candidatus Gottesmanbacteria bacterium RIFCSPLOWO2_01_FULL_43_11b]